ncbi:MAG TPA: response regulator transcription factor [Jatrophihabitantaceae bacterium]|jgi:DNA-binding NarL/FixJ family response regulator
MNADPGLAAQRLVDPVACLPGEPPMPRPAPLELSDASRRLALVGGSTPPDRNRPAVPIPIRLYATDPISRLGVIAHLRHHHEDVRLVDDGQPANVAIAVAEELDADRIRWLRDVQRDSGLPIVLIIGYLDPQALVTAVEAGICGVIGRLDVTPERLVHLLKAAARGDAELPPQLLRQLLDQVGQLNRQLHEPNGLSFNGLTKREHDVLELVADGLSTREIATALNYSERTIKTVLQDLTIRLHLRNRIHAVTYALRNGWI